MKKVALLICSILLCVGLMGCNSNQTTENKVTTVEDMGFKKGSIEEQLYNTLDTYIHYSNEHNIDLMLESWDASTETLYYMRNDLNEMFEEEEFNNIHQTLSFENFKVLTHTESTATISYDEITQLSGEASDRMVVTLTDDLQKIDGKWKFVYDEEGSVN